MPQAEEGFPLSSFQERAWVQGPEGLQRTLELEVRVEGPFDPRALASAAEAVGERWEILRTSLRTLPGLALPMQVIEPAARSLARRADRAEDSDLDSSPARIRWFSESSSTRLVLSAHPAVADRETLLLWAEEIARELVAPGASPAGEDEEPVQYADLVAAWADMDEAGELAEDRAFWRGLEVPDAPPSIPRLLEWPARGAADGVDAAIRLRREIPLPAAAAERARELGLDLGAVAQAALHHLWTVVSGGPTSFGVASSCRQLMGLEEVLGPMTQWLPSAPEPPAEAKSWRAALDRAASRRDAMEEHQAVAALDPDRTLGAAFIDARLAPSRRVIPAGPAVWRLSAPTGPADSTPVVGSLEDLGGGDGGGDDGLRLALEFLGLASGPRGEALADDLLERWLSVITSLLADPDRKPSPADAFRPGESPTLTAPAEAAALDSEGDRGASLPQELFARAAARPDEIAVRFGDAVWTCGRLAAAVEELARLLLDLGVGSGDRVALFFEHGLETLIAPLAVWSAGAAYVPLDCDSPPSRLAFQVEDTSARYVLHHPDRPLPFGTAGEAAAAACVAYSSAGAQPKRTAPTPGFVPARAAPGDLAYVMYTSGSTGQPNGVRIHHEALRLYLSWAADRLLGSIEVLPAITRLTFDACLKQLFAPILAGREVWILPQSVSQRPADLARALAGRRGLGLNAVPSLWSAMVDAIEDGEAPAPELAALFLGGEPASPRLLERTARLLPENAEIWNLYGLTETTANDVVGRLRPDQPTGLGSPVAGAVVAVVDGRDRALPPWAEGEILIAGPRLTKGYLGREALNRERFVELDLDGRRRRYLRTGDRGLR
ncbi:MAG: AMP-binding protein, partial [Acidobacteriota bacterium]